jgi:hypothetical protein
VPENQQTRVPEHEEYESLCALAAGGLLDGDEFIQFQTHMGECSECRADYHQLSGLITRDLPQGQGNMRQKLATMRAKPLPYSRQRFLRHARAEGVVFSREVETPTRSVRWYLSPVTLAPVAALVVFAIGLTIYHFREMPDTLWARDPAAAQQIAALKQQNSALSSSLSRLSETLAAGQREIQNLRTQLGSVAATADKLRKGQGEAEQFSSRNAQLLDEARNQEKLLADARDEAARINQMRVNDEASLAEQQTRITELSNKLRIASATLDMERQLAASGNDLRELMASRQLHVIDIRDTDANGNLSAAFGRVFLTEGKSLTFYAFDLNQDTVLSAKRGFQVWAAPGSGDAAHSLGFLHVDARGQGRWVLRVDKPEMVKEIKSVYVTVEPAAGGKRPSGQKMLYAYLG